MNANPNYASTASAYLACGWGPLPIPQGTKDPPPDGYTGYRGKLITADDIGRWATTNGAYQVAVRVPPDVVGIDVDDYGGKHGADTVCALEARFGPLPPTWSSTSRLGTRSRIMFFRVPNGTRLPGSLGDGVDVIQHHHRYAVVWPSIHPEGRPYRWSDGAGQVRDDLPEVGELGELPWAWTNELQYRAEHDTHAAATHDEVRAFLAEHSRTRNPDRLAEVIHDCTSRTGSRHDRLVVFACWTMREAMAGIYSAKDAADALWAWWRSVHDEPQRIDSPEFAEAIAWAIAQARAEPERVVDIDNRQAGRELISGPTPSIPRPLGASVRVDASVEPIGHGHLPEVFWDREDLAHIRRAAHVQMVAAEALLGVVLARVALLAPPTLRIPAIIGNVATLDMNIGLVAPSGHGKTVALGLGRTLIVHNRADVKDGVPLGSGEGIAQAFLGRRKKADTNEKENYQAFTAVLFEVDEGRAIHEIGGRAGSTLPETLCRAWSGQNLGQTNASAETSRLVEAGTYRAVVIAAWQPGHASVILREADGLAQRTLWLPAIDSTIPRRGVVKPGPLIWTPPPTITGGAFIGFPTSIVEEVRDEHYRRARGELIVDDLATHDKLQQIKLGSSLALLAQRTDVTVDEDWWRAGMLVDLSARTRAGIAAGARAAEQRERDTRDEHAVRRVIRVRQAEDNADHERAVQTMARALHRCPPGERMTEAMLGRALRSDKRYLAGDAIAALVNRGYAEGDNSEGFAPGPLRPGQRP